MTIKTHVLGYPRIGAQRQMKKAVEAFWSGRIDAVELHTEGQKLRESMWQDQAELDMVCVGDFAWYDHMLNLSMMLGVVPQRFDGISAPLARMFAMARGYSDQNHKIAACEMTKWFNTNYHYLVPELQIDQQFTLDADILLGEITEAQAAGYQVKVVLPGPLNFLYLSKMNQENSDKLQLLPAILKAYQQLIEQLVKREVKWLQLDEPWLVCDADPAWQQALLDSYQQLHGRGINILLATYFGDLKPVSALLPQLMVDGLHLDLVEGSNSLEQLLPQLPQQVLSLGLVNGRNIWCSDLSAIREKVAALQTQLTAKQLWLASSCSLLHVPVSLSGEQGGSLSEELKSWLAFAQEKSSELALLAQILKHGDCDDARLIKNREILKQRQNTPSSYCDEVRKRCKQVNEADLQRSSPYSERIELQRQLLKLPLLPTTTIGSFPQTKGLRRARLKWRKGELAEAPYQQLLKDEVQRVVEFQEQIGLDVLVHGEAERNDMVEYFGEQLAGYAFSRNGWVQSYGSRCVKPPIIYGDVWRPQAMTVKWIEFAQSLTAKPMKAMLTGPVTMLHWSFVRDDLPKADICRQLALALLDEVLDLERAGIKVIQIDEPALREGLPLRRADWQVYLDWAVNSFRLSHSAVADSTQIHTHMCYSEFNDIMAAIAALDADVITIETSRSHNELFRSFEDVTYPNDIGPGVYDIHSPNIPTVEAMVDILQQALRYFKPEQLWVNPDCGLKTRSWVEVKPALTNMVRSAQLLRASVAGAVSSP